MHRTKLVDNVIKNKTNSIYLDNCTGFLYVGAFLKQCTYYVWEGVGEDKRGCGRNSGVL